MKKLFAFAVALPMLARAATFDGAGLTLGTFGEDVKGLPTSASGVDLIIRWTNIFLGFVAPIAVAAIIFGGYQYFLGDEEKGKTWVKNTVIGIVVILLAYAIVNTLLGGAAPADPGGFVAPETGVGGS